MTHHHTSAATLQGTVYHAPTPSTAIKAPEIDPGAGFAAVLLLAGTLAVITGRRAS